MTKPPGITYIPPGGKMVCLAHPFYEHNPSLKFGFSHFALNSLSVPSGVRNIGMTVQWWIPG